jgi:hypothetical protein
MNEQLFNDVWLSLLSSLSIKTGEVLADKMISPNRVHTHSCIREIFEDG